LLARRLPAVHASEDEHAYVIRADLPRWFADRVEVTLEPGVVNQQAEAHSGWKCRNGSPLQLERAIDMFERAFRLPRDADPARATAELRSGRLCVRLPRQTGVRVVPVAVKAENMAPLGLRDAAR
jgi:HSP20 family protein